MGNLNSIFKKEESPMDMEERDSVYLKDKKGHETFLRLRRALYYMKEALSEPIKLKVSLLHEKVKKEMKNKQYSGGQQDPKKRKKLNQILRKYLNQSDPKNKLYIGNVHDDWESCSWEIAKGFMQSIPNKNNRDPSETDTMGILRLISNCKEFSDWLMGETDGFEGNDIIAKVLDVRHFDAHSGSLTCSEKEMNDAIKLIQMLLKHFSQNFRKMSDDGNLPSDEKQKYLEGVQKIEIALESVEEVKVDEDFDKMRELVVPDIYRSKGFGVLERNNRKKVAQVQMLFCKRRVSLFLYDNFRNRIQEFKRQLESILEPDIIQADSNPDNIQYLLVALENEEIFQAEKFMALQELVSSLETNIVPKINRWLMKRKKIYERASAIASDTQYDVLILHCEADVNAAENFRDKIDNIPGLHPPAKTILYEEYVVPGTDLISALDNVLEDCRLVFILCTEAFMQNDLSKFQAEVVKYITLENVRVHPVYLRKQDWKSAPQWLKSIKSIWAWNRSPVHLKIKIEDARCFYLTKRDTEREGNTQLPIRLHSF